MATRFLAMKLTTVNVSRPFTGDFSGHILRQATAWIGGSYGRFSTAYERAEGTRDQRMSNDDDGSTSSYVADKAKEGVKKATEAAVTAGDTVKGAMDGAWRAAKETSQSISDAVAGDDDDDNNRIQVDEVAAEVKEVNQPVDTAEYRAVEELRNKAGGHYDDKVDA